MDNIQLDKNVRYVHNGWTYDKPIFIETFKLEMIENENGI